MKPLLLVWLACVLLVLLFSGVVFDYNLDTYFGKDIPWYADCLAGTILSPVNVSAAVVALVLVECDFPQPILNPKDTQ